MNSILLIPEVKSWPAERPKRDVSRGRSGRPGPCVPGMIVDFVSGEEEPIAESPFFLGNLDVGASKKVLRFMDSFSCVKGARWFAWTLHLLHATAGRFFHRFSMFRRYNGEGGRVAVSLYSRHGERAGMRVEIGARGAQMRSSPHRRRG